VEGDRLPLRREGAGETPAPTKEGAPQSNGIPALAGEQARGTPGGLPDHEKETVLQISAPNREAPSND